MYCFLTCLLFCLLDENQDHGVQKNKVMSQGRGGGGVGRGGGGGGGGWGRGVDCPTKDKQREPADR